MNSKKEMLREQRLFLHLKKNHSFYIHLIKNSYICFSIRCKNFIFTL